MTRNDILIAAGEALFGSRWQTDLAKAIGVNDRTVRRWALKEEVPSQGVLDDLLPLFDRHVAEFDRIRQLIKRPESAIHHTSASHSIG